MKRPSIAIVGAGRLGTTVARRLADAGYPIAEIIVRNPSRSLPHARQLARKVGARIVTAPATPLDADVIWFCVPDSEVTTVAASLTKTNWRGKIAFHSSGALPSDALRNSKKMGPSVASVHPLMTFVAGSKPDIGGASFAIEGDVAATRAARKIVRDLGGEAVRIKKKDKAAYHAFATMICPLLVSLLAASEATAASAGISSREARRRMMPIIRQTLENYVKLGPAGAFSGPIVRGDAETIRQHLRTLGKTPAAKDAYLALARAALAYLPARNKKKLQKLLRRPNST